MTSLTRRLICAPQTLCFQFAAALLHMRPVPSLSLVVPAYNESKNLPQVVPEMVAALKALSDRVELILVDDGSRDATHEVIAALSRQHPEIVGLKLSRNFGKEAAITAGLHEAQGEVVAIMDADGQHPTALLPKMLELWRQGNDVVYAVRTSRDDQSSLQSFMTKGFYRLINSGTRHKIPENAGDFRLMGRQVVDALNALPERHRFMKGLYAWVGFASTAIDYQPQARVEGVSRFGYKGAFSLAITGLLAFSSKPLRALGALGMTLSLIAFAFGVWTIAEHFIYGVRVPGYTTIVVCLMFFSGIQLMGLGVIAEYIGRMYDESKGRPIFIVHRRVGTGLKATDRSLGDLQA